MDELRNIVSEITKLREQLEKDLEASKKAILDLKITKEDIN